MNLRFLLLASLILAGGRAFAGSSRVDSKELMDLINEGSHIVRIAGCNDCHTAGFAGTGGQTPEKDWLLGDSIGFNGPWGTTYPSNLRKFVAQLDVDAFVEHMRGREFRPPMPTPSIRAMSDRDLRALFFYLKNLGDGGSAAPAYLPPGEKPKTPYIYFVPVMARTAKK